MDTFAQSLEQLRTAFILATEQRLTVIHEALTALAQTPAASETLTSLRDQFHNLAGLGGIYGYSQVTTLARTVEWECELLLSEGTIPTPPDLARWKKTHQVIQQELAGGVIPASFAQSLQQPLHLGPSILLVEDDPAQRYALALRLEQQGMGVQTAGTMQEALLLLTRRTIEGVIIDLHLPDGSGYELVRGIRQLPNGEKMPILIFSALCERLDKVEMICSGADGQYEKYVDWEALLVQLSELVEGRREQVRRVLLVGSEEAQEAPLLTPTVFLQQAEEMLAQAQDQSFALIVLDLDQLPTIHHCYEPATGEQVLQSCAQLLRQQLRQVKLVARTGDGQFSLIVPNLLAEDALCLAARLCAELAALPHTAPNGDSFQITCSAGIALTQSQGDFQAWQSAALANLKLAKNADGKCERLAVIAQHAQV